MNVRVSKEDTEIIPYSVEEVAKFLDVEKRSIYKLVDEKKIEAVRVGRKIRITNIAIRNFLKNNIS